EWLRTNAASMASTKFLIDFELNDSETDGAEIIVENGLQRRALLVTSHYDDPDLQDFCAEHGISILAKPFLSRIPVLIRRERGPCAVLLDDNAYVRLSWQDMARARGFDLICVG